VSKATMFQGDDSVLRPAIQISARFVAFAEVTGLHHEPATPSIARFPGIAGEDLNRCEREAADQTQDCELSKMGCYTARSQ